MTSSAVQLRPRLPIVTTRLLVTVRDPHTRAYRPVGFLVQLGNGYQFSYLRREVQLDTFRPLPGLAQAAKAAVSSSRLFPLFSERVISVRRPDRHVSLDALGLPLDAAPMEVLARSRRETHFAFRFRRGSGSYTVPVDILRRSETADAR